MKFSKNREISALVRQFLNKGWFFKHGKKHGKLISPLGYKVTVPNTPSDRRAAKNFRSQLVRKELGI